MIALGVFVAIRLVVRAGEPLTSSPGLDLAFAVFFAIRGAMSLSRWRKRHRESSTPPPTSAHDPSIR
jgi:hypothetical protein